MNAREACTLHKEKFPALKQVPVDVLITLAQLVAMEERQAEHLRKFTHCAVCFKPLTGEETAELKPSHFNVCCTEHAEARTVFQLHEYRQRHGVPDELVYPPFWQQ